MLLKISMRQFYRVFEHATIVACIFLQEEQDEQDERDDQWLNPSPPSNWVFFTIFLSTHGRDKKVLVRTRVLSNVFKNA